MAESMIAHFATADRDDVARRLDTMAIRSGRDYGGASCWHSPDADDYSVLLYEYADHATEFEPDELRRLSTLLGGPPTSAVCLELRRSKGRMAHEAASGLAAVLLREFGGVVQDISGEEYWSLADLETGAADRAARRWWPDAEPGAAPDRQS